MRDHAVVGYRQPIALRKQSVPTRGDVVSVALRMLRGVGSLGGLLVAVLLPKCPLCVAAVLTGAGVGAAAAGVLAPYLKPAGYALSLILFVAVLLRERSAMAKRARAQSCCCSQSSAEEGSSRSYRWYQDGFTGVAMRRHTSSRHAGRV